MSSNKTSKTPGAIHDSERKPILPNHGAPSERNSARSLLIWATGLVFAYLCLGELLPLQAVQRVEWLEHAWLTQQVVLLAVLSTVAVGLASCNNAASASRMISRVPSADKLLLAMNFVPIIAAVGATIVMLLSQPCSVPAATSWPLCANCSSL